MGVWAVPPKAKWFKIFRCKYYIAILLLEVIAEFIWSYVTLTMCRHIPPSNLPLLMGDLDQGPTWDCPSRTCSISVSYFCTLTYVPNRPFCVWHLYQRICRQKIGGFQDEICPELTVLLSSCCCKPLFAIHINWSLLSRWKCKCKTVCWLCKFINFFWMQEFILGNIRFDKPGFGFDECIRDAYV